MITNEQLKAITQKTSLKGAIENAQQQDGPRILEITANAGVFKPTEISSVAEVWSEFLRYGPDSSGYYFLVYYEGDLVLGYACYGPRPLTQKTYDLYWIAVAPGYRGRGIGVTLIQAVEAGARALGGRLIIVETSGLDEYDLARNLYTASGYQAEACVSDFYAPGDDLVIFTKHL